MGSRSSAPAPKTTGPDGLNIQPANLGEPVLAQQTAQQNYNEYRRQPGQWNYNQTNEDYAGAMNGRYSENQGYRYFVNPLPWKKRQPDPTTAITKVQPPNPSPYG